MNRIDEAFKPTEVETVLAKALCAANNGGECDFDATGAKYGDKDYSPEWLYYVDDAKIAIETLKSLGKYIE